MTANEVVIAAGAVVAVILLALAVLACLAALATAAFDRLAPLPPPVLAPDVGMSDAEIAMLCADDDTFDEACALELTYREPVAQPWAW